MITVEVKRMNRDHDIMSILQWYDDDQITLKHYKAGVRTAFELSAESYENDDLLILIYNEDFRKCLKLRMITTVSGCDIYASLYYINRKRIYINTKRIAC